MAAGQRFEGMGPGFLNHWHAEIPVVECDGVCSVRMRDGLIYENRVWFDRAELLAALASG